MMTLTKVKNERNTKMLKSIIKAVATPARLSSYAADGILRYAAAIGGSSAVTYLLTQ